MAQIEYLEAGILYENPKPHVHSRHGYFPGLVKLPSGDLLATLMIAEAFEAPNGTTHLARSRDLGRTWTHEGPLYDKSIVAFETTDSLKATVLRDGSLIAAGYRFHRHDLEEAIGIEATGGIQPGDDIVTFSRDEGRAWEAPRVIERSLPELLEISGPCVELGSGELLAVSAPYKMPDGSNPSGQLGVLLRSRDRGQTWTDTEVFFPRGNLSPLESRLCRFGDRSLAAIVWAFDYGTDRHHANHVVISHDDGHTWTAPIDTGHMGQASGITHLGGSLVATIHAHRAADSGLYVRIADLAGDRWRMVAESVIWGQNRAQTREGQSMTEMFTSLRFGQPSLLRLTDDEFLAAHWSIEDGQGRIRTHRLRIRP